MSFDHVPGVLGTIVRARAQDYAGMPDAVGPARPRGRRFAGAVTQPGLRLVAEVKRASPSEGMIAALDPREAALAYERGGAAAISVLTEPRHFDGNREALAAVVAAVSVPVLRKDFVVHPAMLREASDWGASAALLMVRVLGEQVAAYLELAHHLGLDALVEVHDASELEIALASGAEVIGVNNRDLTTLHIDLDVAPRLMRRARERGFSGLLVAESGYRRPADLVGVRDLADAVLVGSSLAASGNLETATRDLMSV